MKKRWKAKPFDKSAANRLQRELDIDPVFCRLLAQRGVTTLDDARLFFRPRLDDLHDPFLMQDMEAAVARLDSAVQSGERILLYGDYDVDGTTAVAMMHSFLRPFHEKLEYYLPDRYREGYGLSFEGLDYARERGVGLIIAMDCGIKAREQAQRARQLGIDLIICDHHLPEARLPNAAAVLDPKRADCPYPFKELSGCGVAFKLAQAYAQYRAWDTARVEDLLDLVVISIASDVVPIVGENRTMAYFGLQKLNQTRRPGLLALIGHSRRSLPFSIGDIVFGLAPLINAAGRLAKADQAVRLMLAGDTAEAEALADQLDYRNQLRREYDQSHEKEAIELFLGQSDHQDRSSVVLYRPYWHRGVIGIVASRLAEHFFRPTVILTRSDDTVVGSARSVKDFDIHEAISACDGLLLSFGGHQFAAGLSLRPENVAAFQRRFEQVVSSTIRPDQMIPELQYDAELSFQQIAPKIWRLLQQFAPFGPGNRNPVFVARGVRNSGYTRILRNNHMRLGMHHQGVTFNGIAFGLGEAYKQVTTRKPFDVCYSLREDNWNGGTSLQLVVKDIHFPGASAAAGNGA